MRRTVYNPTHRSGDLDLLRERLRSRDRGLLRSLPGDPFRSLERERLRLRDSRSFPAVSRSFLSDESPAIWKEGERRFDCWQGLLMLYAKGCVSLILICLHHTHLHFKNIFVSQNCATFIYQDLTDYYIDLLYKLISFGTTWLHPKEKKRKNRNLSLYLSLLPLLACTYLNNDWDLMLRALPLSDCLFKMNRFMYSPIVSRFG